MYVKNTIRHSLTNNGALLQHCQARQPQVYGSWAAIRYAYRHICPWRAGWHLARLPLTGIKKYTFWIHLEIGKDDQRKKKYFYWLLANFIVILKMLSKKKNRPKSVLFDSCRQRAGRMQPVSRGRCACMRAWWLPKDHIPADVVSGSSVR